MTSTQLRIIIAATVLSGCAPGGGTIAVRGDFAASPDTPSAVVAVEAGKSSPVKDGRFAIDGLTAGPATLRLVRGTDTVGTVSVQGVEKQAQVTLHGLRVDTASGRAFPGSIDLRGAESVLVNGLRMMEPGALPHTVDSPGTVLAISPAADALVFRPDDASLPDMRVVVGLSTASATPDGDPVPAADLRAGDSIRVEGRGDHGYVVASRLTVPRHAAIARPRAAADGAAPADRDAPAREEIAEADESDRGGAASPAPRPAVSVARMAPAPRREPPGRGRGHGGGHGHGRGHGKKG